MKINWTKWDNRYPHGRPIAFGKIDKKDLDEMLRQYGKRAREMMEDKHYDHVLYAIRYFGFGKNRIQFYLQPMKNDEFNDLFGYQEKNTMVYAVHNPKLNKKYPETAEIDLDIGSVDESVFAAIEAEADAADKQFWQIEKEAEKE